MNLDFIKFIFEIKVWDVGDFGFYQIHIWDKGVGCG